MDHINETQTSTLNSEHSSLIEDLRNGTSSSEAVQGGVQREASGNVHGLVTGTSKPNNEMQSSLNDASNCTTQRDSTVTVDGLESRESADSLPSEIERIQTFINSELSESILGTTPSDNNKVMNGKVLHINNDSFDANLSSPKCNTNTDSTDALTEDALSKSCPEEASTASPTWSSSSASLPDKQSELSKVDTQGSSPESDGNCKSRASKKRKLGKSESTSSQMLNTGDDNVVAENTKSVEVLNGPKKSKKRKDLVTPVSGGKKKQPLATYQSQISPDQTGIKLFIKKSSTKSSRKINVKHKSPKEKGKARQKKRKQVSWAEGAENEEEEVKEQSDWGLRLPDTALHKIFMMLTHEEGCLPFLPRASRVCRLWYQAAILPSLWHNIDLTGPWYKEKFKNFNHLKWLCENRLSLVQDLNVGGWKVPLIQNALKTISENCQDLRGLGMMGWKGLMGEHLKFLLTNCPSLARLDLSSICPEYLNNKGACSLMSLTTLAQEMGERLTHLILANNRLSGLPQIVTELSTHCPNLEVLDLSNMKTGSNTTAPLHIEKLQTGCTKLRVIRITNSQIALSQIPLKEQAAAPGFPMLEELSVAGIGVSGLCSTPIVDDSSIERILKCSHKLRLLDVRGCTRISDSSLVRVPAWDLEHLFLSGCYVTRLRGNGLELIAQKWSHSLIEMDLGWSSDTEALDLAVLALAECDVESRLRVLDLCGSSVSLDPVKKVLSKCQNLVSLNLASCRALPRGIKRLYEGDEIDKLKSSLKKRAETQSKMEEVAEGQS